MESGRIRSGEKKVIKFTSRSSDSGVVSLTKGRGVLSLRKIKDMYVHCPCLSAPVWSVHLTSVGGISQTMQRKYPGEENKHKKQQKNDGNKKKGKKVET